MLSDPGRPERLEFQARNLAAKVDRIVVLMMENRSIDHLLGWVGADNGGLTYQEFCPLVAPTRGGPPVGSTTPGDGARPFLTAQTRLPIDPPHDADVTRRQINGGNMQGFLSEFVRARPEAIRRHGQIGGADARFEPMATYAAVSVPTYAHLVKHQVCCASWFASVPTGTWPNRFYLYSGTSGGLDRSGKAICRDKVYDAKVPKTTIFDRLSEAGVTCAIYTHNLAWIRLYPERQKLRELTRPYREFDRHCRQGGDHLPQVVFVDPRYTFLEHEALRQNDDHPPANMLDGQQLVADVYRALSNLPDADRERTLFVLTYDEHGGFYDHVPPPPPIGTNPEEDPGQFATYGCRVPAFVCGAYAPEGVFSHELFDHASIYATIQRRFLPGQQFPSERVALANTLGALLTRATPREAFPTDGLPRAVGIGHQVRQEERQQRRDEHKGVAHAFVDGRGPGLVWKPGDQFVVRDREERSDDRQERRDDRQERRDDRPDSRAERRDEREDDRQERRDDREERRDGDDGRRLLPGGDEIDDDQRELAAFIVMLGEPDGG